MSSFAQHIIITGGATLTSRILGFVRDAAMAWLLGAGPVADALAAALRVPWAVRRLLGEGALSLGLTAACACQKNPARTALSVARYLILRLAFLTVLALFAAPWIADVLAPGAAPDVRSSMILLLRLSLPYVPLAMIAACFMAALHASDRFALPGLMPVSFNLTVIAATVGAALFSHAPAEQAAIIACGVLAGGVIQWLPGFFVVRQARREPMPDRGDIARIVRLLPAGLMGAGMAQLAFLLGGVWASWLPDGHMAALFYAERLLEFPLGVLGATVAMAAGPELRRNNAFAAPLLEWTLCLHLAATAGLMAIATPLVMAIYGHGAFTPEAVQLTATNLHIYSLALPAYALSRPLLTLCHTPGLHRIPVLSACAGLFICLVCGGLVTFNGIPGLPPAYGPALGATLALWTQTGLLWFFVSCSANLRLPLSRCLLSFLAAVAAFFAAHTTLSALPPSLFSLLLSISAGVAAWLITLLIFASTRSFYLQPIAAKLSPKRNSVQQPK